MKISRVQLSACLLFLFFCFLIYKLADIQLISTENYGPNNVNLLEESVDQRSSEIILSSGRGIILDRNKEPLSYGEVKDIVLFPFVSSIELPEDIEKILYTIDVQWKSKLVKEKEPVYLSQLTGKKVSTELYDKISNATIPGLVAIKRSQENDPTIAAHLIGLVRNNPDEYFERYQDSIHSNKDVKPIGISGLQKAFDSLLISQQEQRLMYHVDALGNPLLGLELRYLGSGDHFYPAKIRTTIDATIQTMIENVLNSHQMEKGGVVLLDVSTNEVVAMASRPNMRQDHPYINHAMKNQMLTAHFPGSLFKTVVAAAAIENNRESLDKIYDCNRNVYGDGSSSRQLGELNFKESFVESCNYTFASIAKVLLEDNSNILQDYTNKLGLSGPVGWTGNLYHQENFKQFPEEELGRVWGDEYDPFVDRAIAQTAIGQKEVKVTPLAVANMVSTIVNNGVKREISVVDEILYNNGTIMKEFSSKQSIENSIEPETAIKLKALFTEVVNDGTGKMLNDLSIAGKSGTAETGRENSHHYWFAGFFPVENPKYSMVVVDLDQTSEIGKTYPIYHEIADNLMDQ
ncbi:peptidoglycan D,D-transpeptidase FtsI family protein [Aquibacillus albus]|uniref:serine-type D-Ala-D-Ala carboxypeptidase n=1 Tax=Aquibacillus albus TaxID=1168171 RepID=A0ABS2MUQ3_9BACI|nr:penicillin-binding transpeptidase domain-containing protein [Aquibacillus albus]MBM7569577.1 cell division protein FtsI/penicillin-binding protein 2 [Aquibacillus albus]